MVKLFNRLKLLVQQVSEYDIVSLLLLQMPRDR